MGHGRLKHSHDGMNHDGVEKEYLALHITWTCGCMVLYYSRLRRRLRPLLAVQEISNNEISNILCSFLVVCDGLMC
jgi:hypothetical protein